EPDVTEAAPEETTLPFPLGRHAERAEPPPDGVGVEPFAVVGAAHLVAPVEQRRGAQPAQLPPPQLHELAFRLSEAKDDPAPAPSRRGDRRVGVRHELGDDLREIEPALREVLPEVASA